jgi:hypothetical protein
MYHDDSANPQHVTPPPVSEAIAHPLRVLAGGVDTHVHVAPFINEDSMVLDVFELAREAAAAGLRAVVVKSFFGSSCPMAFLANKYANGATVVGGVTLNWAVGGINPDAVRVAAHEGVHMGFRPGRVVWMPEKASLHNARIQGKRDLERHLSPFRNGDPDAGLTPEARLVCEVVAQEDMVLATSHLGPEEGLALIEEAAALGARRFLITHASSSLVGYTLEQKKRAAALGAYIEEAASTWETGMRIFGFEPIDPQEHIVAAIKEIGAAHFVLGTDSGSGTFPKPADALRVFVAILLANGIEESDVRAMVVDNPVELLGLDRDDSTRRAVTRNDIFN